MTSVAVIKRTDHRVPRRDPHTGDTFLSECVALFAYRAEDVGRPDAEPVATARADTADAAMADLAVRLRVAGFTHIRNQTATDGVDHA